MKFDVVENLYLDDLKLRKICTGISFQIEEILYLDIFVQTGVAEETEKMCECFKGPFRY
jgi:hypothetical protein